MEITNVRIKKTEEKNRLRAVATITIDDCFVVHDLKVIEGSRGLFIAMPTRKNLEGAFIDVAHPINTETRRLIEQKVLEQYQTLLDEQE